MPQTPLTDHKINEVNDNITIVADGDPGDCGLYYIDYGDAVHVRSVLLQFQKGPVSEAGLNGITNEALIAIVLDRLRRFQSGDFKCRENAVAITKLEEGLMWLHKRTLDRVRRGVEGKSEP